MGARKDAEGQDTVRISALLKTLLHLTSPSIGENGVEASILLELRRIATGLDMTLLYQLVLSTRLSANASWRCRPLHRHKY